MLISLFKGMSTDLCVRQAFAYPFTASYRCYLLAQVVYVQIVSQLASRMDREGYIAPDDETESGTQAVGFCFIGLPPTGPSRSHYEIRALARLGTMCLSVCSD